MGGLERLRILEGRHGTGRAAIDAAQPGAFLLFVQRVASAAALFEKLLAMLAVLCLCQSRERQKREERYPQRDATCHHQRYAVLHSSILGNPPAVNPPPPNYVSGRRSGRW